jgi:hypothetical protein
MLLRECYGVNFTHGWSERSQPVRFQADDAGPSEFLLFLAFSSMVASIKRRGSFLPRARTFNASNVSTSALAVRFVG